MVEREAPNGSGSRQNGPSGPEIRLESTKGGARGGGAEAPASPGDRARPAVTAAEAMDHPI